MYKLLPTLLLVFGATLLSAQVTISTNYFPAIGDTLKTSITDSIYANSLDLQLDGGADLFWSFGTPTATTNLSEPVMANTDPLFPDADFVLRSNIVNLNYYRITDDAMELVGVRNRLDLFPDFELTAPVNPARAVRRAPLNFEDEFATVTQNQTVISPDSLPAEALDLIGDAFDAVDSLRITTTSTRNDLVDAWGTVRLGDNYYDVLREKRRESIFIDLEAKAPGIPIWVNVTAALALENPEFSDFLGQQAPTVTYIFWNDESKEPIGSFEVDPETNIVERMEYKRAETATSTNGPGLSQAKIKVFPNPAVNLATFEMEGLQRGNYDLTLLNLLGKQVASRSFSPLGDQTRINLDVTELPSGIYLYTLRNEAGRTITTKKLRVR